MKIKRSFRLLMALTILNTAGLLGLVTWHLIEPRHVVDGQDLRDVYTSLPSSELSLRFVHPELYEGLDDFARANALQEILRRRLIRRGMNVDSIRQVLGHPDSSVTAEGSSGITLGKPFEWHYDRLFASTFVVHFGADQQVARIRWLFDHPHESQSQEF